MHTGACIRELSRNDGIIQFQVELPAWLGTAVRLEQVEANEIQLNLSLVS